MAFPRLFDIDPPAHSDGVLGGPGAWLAPGLHGGCIGATVMVFWVGEVVGWYPVCIGGV